MLASWKNSKSRAFQVQNGVKQGAILSPILFTVYMDEMLCELKKSGIGCQMNGVYAGALGYADDVTLLCPSLQ